MKTRAEIIIESAELRAIQALKDLKRVAFGDVEAARQERVAKLELERREADVWSGTADPQRSNRRDRLYGWRKLMRGR